MVCFNCCLALISGTGKTSCARVIANQSVISFSFQPSIPFYFLVIDKQSLSGPLFVHQIEFEFCACIFIFRMYIYIINCFLNYFLVFQIQVGYGFSNSFLYLVGFPL